MNRYRSIWILLAALLWLPQVVCAAADLEINTPAIGAIKKNMQERHGQLAGYYASGAVGLTLDGMIALHDAGAVPLAQRQAVQSLIADENRDRAALYKEIAHGNGHPEWEDEVRATFAQRWIDKAAAGWWYQSGKSAWVRK